MSDETSSGVEKLAAALAKAQAQIQHADKAAINPHFRNKYATLADIWDACRAALTSNGIAVVQMPTTTPAERLVHVETVLLHSSGQSMTSTLSMPVDKANAQGVGSAITYARRYALAAVVGVAPDDDDGNEVSRPRARSEPRSLPRNGDVAAKALDAIAAAEDLDALNEKALPLCQKVTQGAPGYEEVRAEYAARRKTLSTEAA